MREYGSNINLPSLDNLFSSEQERQDAKLEKIQILPLTELHPFRNHPFQVRDDDEMDKMVDSIKEYGVMTPAIVRPRKDGGYEIVAGHRRCHASQRAGVETMPCIVRDMDDDTAIILMVDSKVDGATIEIEPITKSGTIDGGTWNISPADKQTVTTAGHTNDDNFQNNGGAASASWTLHYSVSKTTDSRNGRVGPYTTQDEADAAADSARDAAIAELQGEAQRMVDNAVASAKAELANIKFRYEEVGVPYGFAMYWGSNGSKQTISVSANSNNAYLMKNDEWSLQVNLKKTDSETGNQIAADAQYEIFQWDTVTGKYQPTGGYNTYSVQRQGDGTYAVINSAAYLTTKNILFWKWDDWKLLDDATVIMQDDITKVQISKKDLTTNEELPGAELIITDEKGSEIDRWISTDAPHYMEKLPAGKYTLTEVTAPDGYAIAERMEFEVLPNGEVQTFEMFDDTIKVKISKVDITTNEELPGAELVIKDKDGTEIDRWISTNEPHYVEKMPAGDYTLTEITAPSGYKVAESIDFTVLPTGEIQTVVMKDAREDTPTPTPDNTPTPNHTPQPTPNTTPAPTPVPAAPTATPTPLLTIPKTGDNSSLGLLLAIAGISLAGLAVLVHKSARRKDIAPRDDDDEDTED